jgi:hypothetical protein
VHCAEKNDLSGLERIANNFTNLGGDLVVLINTNDEILGRAALHAAADFGSYNVVEWLMENGAEQSLKCNENGFCPIHYAARSGRRDVVLHLLQCRGGDKRYVARDGRIPIELAQEYNKINVDYLFKDPPMQVQDFKPLDVEAYRMSFEWNPPEFDGGEPIEIYQLKVQRLDRFIVQKGDIEDADSVSSHSDDDIFDVEDNYEYVERGEPKEYETEGLSLLINDVLPATYYDVYVSSRNRVGWTAPEEIFCFRLRTASAPPDPMAPVFAISTTSHTVSIGWKPPLRENGERILKYECQCRRSGGGVWRTIVECACVNDKYTMSRVTSGTSFKFRIRVSNVCGWSSWSAESPPIASNASAEVVERDSRHLKLAWKQPYFNRVRFRGSFEVQRRRVLNRRDEMRLKFLREHDKIDESGWTKEERGEWVPSGFSKKDSAHITIENLLPATTFEFRIRCVLDPEMDWGEGIECDAVRTEIDCPDESEGLERGEISDTCIDLVWKKAYDNGLPVEEYEVSLAEANAAEQSWCKAATIEGTGATVSGLEMGVYYLFRVRAYNEVGWGAYSKTIKVRTRAIPAPEPPKVDTREAGDTFVRIKWPLTYDKCKYEIIIWHAQYARCSRVNEDAHTAWEDATPNGGQVEGLTESILVVPIKPVAKYVFRLRAKGVGDAGWSAWSTKSNIYQSGRRF